MRESQFVLEMKHEAAVATWQGSVLRVLELRCKAQVPDDLTQLIRANQELNLLSQWLDAAAEASNFDEFRAAMQPGQSPGDKPRSA